MNNYELVPFFQPIISISQKAIFGHEVLARGKCGNELILPKDLFSGKNLTDKLNIDRVIRMKTMKKCAAENYKSILFINFPPEYFSKIQSIKLDSHLMNTCEQYNIPPENVVIEITESVVDNFSKIVNKLSEYSKLGFKIAIDDWGAEYSNFDRLAKLQPSIVKFDAAFLWQAAKNPMIRELYVLAAEMITKLGIKIIAEGIETIEQLFIAMDAGFPLVQGFYWAKPESHFCNNKLIEEKTSNAIKHYNESKLFNIIQEKRKINAFIESINNSLPILSQKLLDLDRLETDLITMMKDNPKILKSYILGHDGTQISPNLIRKNGSIIKMMEMLNRDWSWRPYFIESQANKKLYKSKYTFSGPYIDPELNQSVYTICINIDTYNICLDFINED